MRPVGGMNDGPRRAPVAIRAIARLGGEVSAREGYWVWLGGPVPPGSAAITLWTLVVVRAGHGSDSTLMAHEAAHVHQWQSLGPWRFGREYLGAYFSARRLGYGHVAAYRLIPLEEEAEMAAREATEGP
ncbi:MAG: hypothetical protein ACT4OS_09715 [Acidimicrobiales bacterium]